MKNAYEAAKKLMKNYTYEIYVKYMKEFQPNQPLMTEKEFEALKEEVEETEIKTELKKVITNTVYGDTQKREEK